MLAVKNQKTGKPTDFGGYVRCWMEKNSPQKRKKRGVEEKPQHPVDYFGQSILEAPKKRVFFFV